MRNQLFVSYGFAMTPPESRIVTNVDCQEPIEAEWEPSGTPGFMKRIGANGKIEIKSINSPTTGVSIPPAPFKEPPYKPKDFYFEYHYYRGRTSKPAAIECAASGDREAGCGNLEPSEPDAAHTNVVAVPSLDLMQQVRPNVI